MKPSPKHVAVTSIDGESFFANTLTSFKSTRFFFELGFELFWYCAGYLAVAKYTYRTPRAALGGWSRPRSRTSRATSASCAASCAASPTRGLTARSRSPHLQEQNNLARGGARHYGASLCTGAKLSPGSTTRAASCEERRGGSAPPLSLSFSQKSKTRARGKKEA